MSNCTVYIDESGDLGVNKGTRWFVLSAVIVEKTDEPMIRTKIDKIRTRLNIKEIHYTKITNFYKRAFIVRELKDLPFTYMNVLVDTSKFDVTKIPSASIAYNYVCKYLLQRVSWYLRDNSKTADIVLSARGTSRDGELIHYIKEKVLPYPDNNVDESLFNKITAKASSSWDLLQLADVCATTMFLTYQVNEFGFTTPCFSLAFLPHLYKKNGNYDSYGIKFFAPIMKPEKENTNNTKICKS